MCARMLNHDHSLTPLFANCTDVCFAAKVAKCLEEVGLSADKNIVSKKLSGGQKRKLSLAMAIIGEPRVVIILVRKSISLVTKMCN